MQWLSADFAQERRWKRGVARKVVRMVMRHHEEVRQKEEKAKRDEHAKIRRVASSIAKEVRAFWSSVEKVVQYKQQSRLEEKRKKALDLQLDFIVGQTEKYSDLLSQSLAPASRTESVPSPTKTSSVPSNADEEDRDFEPPCEEDDDEETIEVEEQQDGNDAESRRREIELLKEESTLPLDQLLSTLQQPRESVPDEECAQESSSSSEEQEEEDGEFAANEEDAEDEEYTIAAQEKVEGNMDHAEELDDLAKEGDMSMEELLEKYKGAYASDVEEASASVPASKASSEWEASGDEENDSDEEDSDLESNTSSSASPRESDEEENSQKDGSEEEGEEEEEGADEGMEVLLKEGGDHSPSSSSASRPKKEISHIAATAESLQPKGYTLATTKVKTPIPFLLHGTLREYQHIGLDWLVTMFEKKLNGILADEMGLGKTIQTIALLAHLACEKNNWGPHLIIVPTSVMLNWEMELKRWCPGFKILTYFGSQKERKLKRQGWTKPNAFHVCITSYKLVLQDHQAFRRKSWRYLILDEAQNIKNFKSQRWQSLLNFNSHRRLLLTGTPLQNSLMELWSLMHFLMPHVFQSHREFKEWFSNPLTGMIEGSQEYNEGLVKRLHKVLRPFLLRRIKADVEKQMPKKYEHVVRCRLSKRQRFLYDDFMAQASTKETLASGHFMSVINILMQLRKVCNHPNLFDPRPIQSPFITKPIVFRTASLVLDALEVTPMKRCDLSMFDLVGLEGRVSRYQADVFVPKHKVSRQLIEEIVESPEPLPRPRAIRMKVNRMAHPPPKGDTRTVVSKASSSVPPATQTSKPPSPEVATPPSVSAPAPVPPPAPAPVPIPVVQQVVCSVTTAPPPRTALPPGAQTAVRSSIPKHVLTVRPPPPPPASCTTGIPVHPPPNPGSIMPQRVLLSPDMQARLPSGEVVSIAQLASLAGRPISSCQGSKPVTFQLQGNKLTLSGAPIRPAPPRRPVQANVMHLLSSGGQHHLISQPAQVTVQNPGAAHRLPLGASTQVTASSVVSTPGVVKIVVRQAAGKEGSPVPTLAVAPSPRAPSSHPHPNATPVRSVAPLQVAQRTPGPATAHYTLAPPRIPSSTSNQAPPPVPILKIVQAPPPRTEQPAPAEATASCSTSKPAAHEGTSKDTTVTIPASTPSAAATATTTATATATASTSQTPAVTKAKAGPPAKLQPPVKMRPRPIPRSPFYTPSLAEALKKQRDSKLDFIFRVNERHSGAKPVYGKEVLDFLTFLPGPRPTPAAPRVAEAEWGRSGHAGCLVSQWRHRLDLWRHSRPAGKAIHSIEERLTLLSDIVDRFTFAIPPVEASRVTMHCCHPPPSLSHQEALFSSALSTRVAPLTRSLHRIQCSMRTQFPDLRLIQYDCGKLQTLHLLLRNLKTGGHRVLIFTQMTRMLDILEQFLNYHGHIYLRLDGSTRVEQRQALMERFNADRRIFCFILSTRSGGVGVNLTGADTVVFYDSDWNPTMDAQAQDRCHRIGQTRDVHIYRLISERTVEENILKKANQKRMLGDMAIEGGNFTTAFFKEQTIRDLFDVNESEKKEPAAVEVSVPQVEDEEASNKQSTTILEQALCRAEDEEDIVAASQAKAEQVAELAEFNENIPLDDAGEQEDVEELSKAEQEIAALVEQLTPIERYAMNFLEASLEDVCKEELKQAEEQVEAARKGLDQAKEGGLKLHASSDEDDVRSAQASAEAAQPAPARRGRKPKPKDKAKAAPSTRISGRLRGASPEMEPEAPPPREVPERARAGLRGRAAAAKESGAPSVADPPKIPPAGIQVQDPSGCSKDSSSPTGDQRAVKPQASAAPAAAASSPSPSTSPPGAAETDSKTPKRGKEESPRPAERQAKDEETKDQSAMSPPPTSCRSPRKRQSADGEVLKGHVEDSTSAKVLRKLPGRLVTVVEEKEPRKKRWRGGGAGASWEEPSVEENSGEDGTKDARPPTGDGASTDAATKSCQDQDSGPNPAAGNFQPVRAYPPYSPPHLSPDMPVLRNLPVRRRLETESRMAAQLSEQLQLLRGKNQHKKSEKESSPASTEGNANSPETPTKRKRGRPPKCPLNAASPPLPPLPPPPLATQPVSPGEDGSLSPKRKRGRPRKDSASSPDFAFDGQKPAKESSGESNPDVGEDPSTSEDKTTPRDRLPAKTEGTDSSKPAESEVATANPNQISYPISNEDTAEPRVASPNPLTSFSSSQQVPTALNSEPSSQPVGSFSPPPPAPDLSRPSEASAERHSGRSAIGAPSADGSPSPPASEKDGKDQIGELPVEPSAASPLPTNTTPSMEAPSKKSDPVKSEPVPPDTAKRQTSSLAFTTTPGDPSKSAAFSEEQTGVASPNDVPQPVTPSSSTSHSSPAEAPKTKSSSRTVENASEASPKESKKTPATLTSNPRPSEEEADRTNHTEADKVEMDQDAHSDTKRRKVEISAEKKEKPSAKCDSRPEWDIKPPAEETPTRKRSLSRQSSQDSARSSSPSSGCSTSTLTRHAHHKRTYENRHPTKKRRVDVTSGEATAEGKPDEDGRQKVRSSASGSSSSSCDSDNDKRGKSRGSRGRSRDPDRSQDPVREPGGRRRGKKHAPGSDANASTGGDSGSDSSSARMGRVAAGSSPSPGGHTPPRPPEPEVLGKRCSALNAAAKLLAMKGRVDTPGHTPRKDSAAKTAANAAAGAAAPDAKPQSKKLPLSPPNNSVGKTKVERKPSSALKDSRPASRSTRQCPGSLVPPLVGPEYKRCKSEGAKAKEAARGDGEAQRPEDGGNDLGAGGGTGGGKVDGGGDLGTDRKPARGSRSRSSSDSSRRAHSVSSQNAERKGAGSRAASSGSDRDRSAERGGKTRKGPRGAHRPIQESAVAAATTPGAEGTANRVLRSVAAAAAVQARSPAASTRSSANQQRHNKT
ncbi:helicase SRCAP [Stigmatopora argus]